MPRFSANLGFLWADLPLLERISAAADAGFVAVELHYPYDTDPHQVRDLCAERELLLLGLNTNVGPDHSGLAALPGRQKDYQELVSNAFDWAAAAGARYVHVMAGQVPEDQRKAAHMILVDNLKWAASRAGDLDLCLLVEPLNRTDMPNYYYSKVAQAVDIIEAVNVGNLKLMFDAYHVAIEGDPVVQTFRDNFRHIGHIQVASVPDRNEPDLGEFKYAPFFELLDLTGYLGWVGCEYRPLDKVEKGLVWAENLGVRLQRR